MSRDVRYCTTSDGIQIAYAVEGDGPPLIACQFFVESFSQTQSVPEYEVLMAGIGRGRRLIRYDMRGTGLSQRDVEDVSHEATVNDLEAVALATEAQRVAVYGCGLSGVRAISFAARRPDLVSELLLYSTFARPRAVMTHEQVAAFAQLASANWPVAAQALADLSGRQDEGASINVRGAALNEHSTSGTECARMILALSETGDASPLLASIKARTLVVQWIGTQLFTPATAREIAAGIPNSKLVLLEGTTNWLGGDAPLAVASEIQAFLSGRERPQTTRSPGLVATHEARSGLRTVLFTDLVGHTEMMQRLGDARGRAVLREHEEIIRGLLARYAGDEMKATGDGFMASFASVAAAVECAIALQRAFAERNAAGGEPLSVRVGLDVGEPVEDGGDLFGTTVIRAARITAEARGGQILMPEAVRHLLGGKDFRVTSVGAARLKGFDLPLDLCEVDWSAAV